MKTKQTELEKNVVIRKVNGGYVIGEQYLKCNDEVSDPTPYVCTNIDQVLALVEKLIQ